MQHGAVAGDKQVELLDDVQEDLVLAVLDALRAPRDRVGHSRRWLSRLVGPVALLQGNQQANSRCTASHNRTPGHVNARWHRTPSRNWPLAVGHEAGPQHDRTHDRATTTGVGQ